MLALRLLGELQVAVDGRRVPAPVSGRARELLGWLALHPGLHRRAGLAARLWPDVLDASARASLPSTLWTLRSELDARAATQLHATRDRVGLDGELWTDVGAFGDYVDGGRLAEAIELCRGELLADLSGHCLLYTSPSPRDS